MALDVCRGGLAWAPTNSELAEYNPKRLRIRVAFLLRKAAPVARLLASVFWVECCPRNVSAKLQFSARERMHPRASNVD
jgi:hypothetical protein